MRRLILVAPPCQRGLVEAAGRSLPLNLLYVAAAARRAGVEVGVFDARSRRAGLDEIRALLRAQRPDFVGISSITSTVPSTVQLARVAKEADPGVRVIVGGVHPSMLADEMLRAAEGNIDFAVCGEGEATIVELLRAFENGIEPESVPGVAFLDPVTGEFTRSIPRPPLEDLELYSPAFDLADWSLYRYFVIPKATLAAVCTSRGEPASLRSDERDPAHGTRWRPRRPACVVDEISTLRARHGVDVVMLTDPYATHDRGRWEEILNCLAAIDSQVQLIVQTNAENVLRDEDLLAKYRRAGVIHLYVRLPRSSEDPSDRRPGLSKADVKAALALVRAHGMLTEASLLLGGPQETDESISGTLELARYYNPDLAHFNCVTPWPYSRAWRELRDRVRVMDYSRYTLFDPIVEPQAMTLADLDDAVFRCYREFYVGKMLDLPTQPNDFRKDYVLSALKLIMKSEFFETRLQRSAVPSTRRSQVGMS